MFGKKYKDEINKLNAQNESLTNDNLKLQEQLNQANIRVASMMTKYYHNIEYDNILAKISSATKSLDDLNTEIATQRSNLAQIESKIVQATNLPMPYKQWAYMTK